MKAVKKSAMKDMKGIKSAMKSNVANERQTQDIKSGEKKMRSGKVLDIKYARGSVGRTENP